MNIEPNISAGVQISLITWPDKQELNSSTAPLKGFRGTLILFTLPDTCIAKTATLSKLGEAKTGVCATKPETIRY